MMLLNLMMRLKLNLLKHLLELAFGPRTSSHRGKRRQWRRKPAAPGFLMALRHAALNATIIGLLDRARQEPGVRAIDRGDKHSSVQDLVDEINVNLPVGDAPEQGQGSTVAHETSAQSGVPHGSAPFMHRSAIRYVLNWYGT